MVAVRHPVMEVVMPASTRRPGVKFNAPPCYESHLLIKNPVI